METTFRIGEGNKTHLYCPQLYPRSPDFFQAIRPLPILTEEILRTSLDQKKIIRVAVPEEISTTTTTSTDPNITGHIFIVALVVCAASAMAFDIANSITYEDPIRQPVVICSDTFQVLNTETNQTGLLRFEFPCDLAGKYFLRGITKTPMIVTGVLASFFIIPMLVSRSMECFECCLKKITDGAESVGRYSPTWNGLEDEHLDNAIRQLAYVDDITAEAVAENVGLLFPFLPDDQLVLLNFSQLKKAKKKWKEIFEQKVDASLFAVKQLSIWRLFGHLTRASEEDKLTILRQDQSQQIIGTEPLFFQHVVRKITPLNQDKISILCHILTSKILTKEATSKLVTEDVETIVSSVSDGCKLRDVIQWKLDSKTGFFVDLPVQHSMETIEARFQSFLQTGKLRVQSRAEIFQFFKVAIENHQEMVVACLEKYFFSHLDMFQSSHDVLEQITNLKLDSLKLKVDQYLEQAWRAKEGPSIDSEQFVNDYQFAQENGLIFCSFYLKEYYLKKLDALPLPINNVKSFVDQIHKIFKQIDDLFGDQQVAFLECLEKRVDTFFNEHPQLMENIVRTAQEAGNGWLVDCAKRTYLKNCSLFEVYWLMSPFVNVDVVVDKETI